MIAHGHTIDPATGIRTVYRNGVVISVNRETAAARISRLIDGAAGLRRGGHVGDYANARGLLIKARNLRLKAAA